VLDVSSAVAQVRRGQPALIGRTADALLALPAAVIDAEGVAAMAEHGRPAVVINASRAARLGLRDHIGGLALAGDRDRDRDVVTVARALSGAHADRTWFREDDEGPRLRIVPDEGVVVSDDLPVLAAELSDLAGFGPVTVTVEVERGGTQPMVIAATLIRRALLARGALPVSGPARLPLVAGSFSAYVVKAWDGVEHLVVTPPEGPGDGPVRVVRSCVVGQTFRSSQCGCRHELEQALADVAAAGRGALVYLQPASNGVGGLVPCTAESATDCSARDEVLADVALTVVRRLGSPLATGA
jgi:hypothetical protein